jgi:ammonia channel protein AmtB
MFRRESYDGNQYLDTLWVLIASSMVFMMHLGLLR